MALQINMVPQFAQFPAIKNMEYVFNRTSIFYPEAANHPQLSCSYSSASLPCWAFLLRPLQSMRKSHVAWTDPSDLAPHLSRLIPRHLPPPGPPVLLRSLFLALVVAQLEVEADFVNSAWDAVTNSFPGTEGDWCFAEGSFEGEPVKWGTEIMLDAMMGKTPNPGEWERKAGGAQSPLMTRQCRTAEGLVFITDFVLPVFGCLEKARAMKVNIYKGGSRTGSTKYSAKRLWAIKFTLVFTMTKVFIGLLECRR